VAPTPILYSGGGKWHNRFMQDEWCPLDEISHPGGAGYCLLKLKSPALARQSKPGQFVMVQAGSGYDPLLRRPLGILKCDDSHFWLYFQILGRGTSELASLKPGDRVRVLGPLGNGFSEYHRQRILLIAGGRGIVPLFFFAQRFAADNELFLIYGARRRQDLNLLEEIAALPIQERILRSEDGSSGEKGMATDGVTDLIDSRKITVTLSCGPEAMLKWLAEGLSVQPTENWVSLEAMMGCGFGICHSCVAEFIDGRYRKVCQDGPVFRLAEVRWST